MLSQDNPLALSPTLLLLNTDDVNIDESLCFPIIVVAAAVSDELGFTGRGSFSFFSTFSFLGRTRPRQPCRRSASPSWFGQCDDAEGEKEIAVLNPKDLRQSTCNCMEQVQMRRQFLSHNVELEAAKFLHRLIQGSTDEPAKLTTKLYVILQHMKSSGKDKIYYLFTPIGCFALLNFLFQIQMWVHNIGRDGYAGEAKLLAVHFGIGGGF